MAVNTLADVRGDTKGDSLTSLKTRVRTHWGQGRNEVCSTLYGSRGVLHTESADRNIERGYCSQGVGQRRRGGGAGGSVGWGVGVGG